MTNTLMKHQSQYEIAKDVINEFNMEHPSHYPSPMLEGWIEEKIKK